MYNVSKSKGRLSLNNNKTVLYIKAELVDMLFRVLLLASSGSALMPAD